MRRSLQLWKVWQKRRSAHAPTWLACSICRVWRLAKRENSEGEVMSRAQSRTPKYEMTVSDIRRNEARERAAAAAEAVARALLEKGVEPQLSLRVFAERFRGGDLDSVRNDVKLGHLPVIKSEKNHLRKIDMVAYFSAGAESFLKGLAGEF
ncbi:hypothetical protein D0V11_15240 [Salmonella enterica]|nr:hypothetical protein [Salmonella enterica]EAU2296910.1 hypothetical protein [Salmonella enterica]EBN7969317.1 hypothetical protein [Salmonella enterica]